MQKTWEKFENDMCDKHNLMHITDFNKISSVSKSEYPNFIKKLKKKYNFPINIYDNIRKNKTKYPDRISIKRKPGYRNFYLALKNNKNQLEDLIDFEKSIFYKCDAIDPFTNQLYEIKYDKNIKDKLFLFSEIFSIKDGGKDLNKHLGGDVELYNDLLNEFYQKNIFKIIENIYNDFKKKVKIITYNNDLLENYKFHTKISKGRNGKTLNDNRIYINLKVLNNVQ